MDSEAVSTAQVDPPIPLAAPDGRIFAYACPRCLRPKASVSCADFNAFVAHSLEFAAKCCLCRRCGVPLQDSWSSQCDPCNAIVKAEQQAYTEKMQPEWDAQAARRDAALATAKDQNAASILVRLMSDISEEYYCAGWMSGLEFSLWRMVQGGDRSYGMSEVSEDEVTQLKQLSEQCGGWWYFNDDDGETFILVDDWNAMLAKPESAT